MIRERFLTTLLIAGLAQAIVSPALMADEAAEQTSEQAIKEKLEKVVFVSHDVGAPKVTETGGVRGILTAPKLFVLAPDHAARSLSPSPTLYYYVSKATEAPVQFMLLADEPRAATPILTVELDAPAEPGIYAVALADHDVSLEAGHRYAWSVAMPSAGDPSSGRPIAQTLLEHLPPPDLNAFSPSGAPFDQTVALAGQGYWYDALEIVSRQIEAGERSLPWRDVRARLLDQVGLRQIALYDRLQGED